MEKVMEEERKSVKGVESLGTVPAIAKSPLTLHLEKKNTRVLIMQLMNRKL